MLVRTEKLIILNDIIWFAIGKKHVVKIYRHSAVVGGHYCYYGDNSNTLQHILTNYSLSDIFINLLRFWSGLEQAKVSYILTECFFSIGTT